MSKKKTYAHDENSPPEVERAVVSDMASGGIMRRYQLGTLWI
jgi:hypothetical protein